MATDCCSISSCGKPGTLLCTGCTRPQSRYCSKECQELDWKTHKRLCAGAQKYNCFLLRASSTKIDQPKLADYLDPFNLQVYGNEKGEISELRGRLGWESVEEMGKFYDHHGADTWYYDLYGSGTSREDSSRKNEIASLCVGKTIFGDVAIVRSGPADSSHYRVLFSKAELLRTAEFYRTADPRVVFAEREKTRVMRKYGF